MHDDFLRITDFTTDGGLPGLPEGFKWSEKMFASISGNWAAIIRPVNLAVCYLKLDEAADCGNGIIDRDTEVFEKLLSERMIQSSQSKADEKELDNLKLQADSGVFRFICILPTNRCEMKCAYCHQRVKPQRQSDMTLGEIDRGLRKCAELCSDASRPADILIYGGEPLLNFAVTKEVIRLTKGRDGIFRQPVRLSFTTSGKDLTDGQAAVLADNDVFVIVSVDAGADINDNTRIAGGESSAYETAERAIKLLKSKVCRVGISVTIGSHNYQDIGNQVDYLISKFQPNDIGLNTFLHPIGDRKNPYQLNWQDAFQALLAGYEAARQYGVFAEQPFRRLRPFVNRNPLLKDCSSPGERLVLVPGGKIGFCDSCYPADEYFYDLADFPDKCRDDYLTWKSLSAPNMPFCRECPAMTVCAGACRYDGYRASGELDGVDENRCHFELAFLNFMIWELFERIEDKSARFIIPEEKDRRKLIESFSDETANQPFLAGSYSE